MNVPMPEHPVRRAFDRSGAPMPNRGWSDSEAATIRAYGDAREAAGRRAALEAVIEQARVAMRAPLNVDVHSSLTEDDVISIDAKMRDALRAIEEVRK